MCTATLVPTELAQQCSPGKYLRPRSSAVNFLHISKLTHSSQ